MSDLKPCPFCGGEAVHIQLNYVIGCQPCGVWMADYRKDEWNRRTQPEATAPAPIYYERCSHPDCGRFKDGAGWSCRAMRDNACARHDAPAQDLSAAIPYGWLQFIDGVKTQNFARDEKELSDIKMMFRLMKHTGKAEYLPVYASPANALSAGDSKP